MIYIKVNIESIEAINAESRFNKLQPIQTIVGDWVLNADILTDDKTWGHAIPYLSVCEQVELTEKDFQQTKLN